jgi:hypothetical protein
MHRMEPVGLDLDASAREFAFERDRLEAVLGKLRLQRLFLDAWHWSAIFPPLNFPRASYRHQERVLNVRGSEPPVGRSRAWAPATWQIAELAEYDLDCENFSRSYSAKK